MHDLMEMACYRDSSTRCALPGRPFGQGFRDAHQVVCDGLPVAEEGEGDVPVELEVHHHLRTQTPVLQAGNTARRECFGFNTLN